ncbi:MAG TPA: tetratricopeptide repeat protein [Blastocatellia bacterium]|nr:tetratricopeptide repeat protein [Blastocatellia bacterium]
MRRIACACIEMALCFTLAATVCAQHSSQGPPSAVSADTNNAVIEGRVTLPSGLSADRNVKITLKNSQSILSTLYSNKHGEFRFDNLSEGVYYVQAEVDGTEFDPAVEKVLLGRGIVWELTLQLREKKSLMATRTGARVISAAELHQQVPAAAKREYEQGVRLVGKGDFAGAAAHFEQALSIFPHYIAARNDLGAQYLKLKRLDEAEESFRSVLEQDPKNFNAKFNLGLVRIERRDYADAISRLNEAMAIDSSRPTARLWLGFALLETGDVTGAERELAKALIMGGAECAAAHYHLARVHLAREEAAEALRSLQSYLQESPRGEYVKEARQLIEELQSKLKRGSKR